MPIVRGEVATDRIVTELEERIVWSAAQCQTATGRRPTLAILSANPDHDASRRYMGLKKRIGERLGITVSAVTVTTAEDLLECIRDYNQNPEIDGLMVQLPLAPTMTELQPAVLASINPAKDVDGLGPKADFFSATAQAVERILEDCGADPLIDPTALIGLGSLVNGPLQRRWQAAGAFRLEGFDKGSDPYEILEGIGRARTIITATGQGSLLTPELFEADTSSKLIIDAGTAGTAKQDGTQHGDVSDELRQYALERGWAITPKQGGVGKVTIRQLLSNVTQAAAVQAGIDSQFRTHQFLVTTSANRPPQPVYTLHELGSDPHFTGEISAS